MFIDIPAKVISGTADTINAFQFWPYETPGDIYWSGGSAPKYYQWNVTVNITEQTHSSNKTRKPFAFNGSDVSVGDYMADTVNGVAVKIVSISSKSDTQITCLVEDVLRYNTFRNPNQLAVGIFAERSSVLIFQLNEEGLPIVDNSPSSVSANFYANLSSRFINMEQSYNFVLNKPAHGFALGDLIGADPHGNTFVLANSAYPYLIGTVTNVDLGPDQFMVNPFQKVIDGYPSLIGNVATIIYADPVDEGEYSLTGQQPVLIKLRQQTNTVVIGSNLDSNSSVDVGSTFTLNGEEIVVANVGSPNDFVTACNLQSSNTSVMAAMIENAPSVTTSPALINDFSVVALQLPASAKINGVTVTFTTSTSGSSSLGPGFADQFDIAADINTAAISGIVASADSSGLTLRNDDLAPIVLENIGVDGLGNPFAGAHSSTGLALLTSLGDSFIQLTGNGAIAINLFDTVNSPTQDFGLISAENGIKAAAMTIEQGIREASTYVVSNIAARDALTAFVGDQAYVTDQGNGEWAFFIFTLDSVWVEIANKDSSETDAQSVELAISATSNASATIHTISNNRRVTFVTVTVLDAFNAPATVTVGDSADHTRLMTVDQNDLTAIGDYSTTPSYTYAGGFDTDINLYFNADGATVGNAIVAITYT
jgi:hypothetical protein